MNNSKIQWTDHTFNPWIGCTKVHTGCKNCYAESDMDTRRGRVKWGPKGTRSKTSETNWREPIKWNRKAAVASAVASKCHEFDQAGLGKFQDNGPAVEYHRPRVFCASLADVFEDWQGPIVDHHGEVLHYHDRDGLPQITMNDLRRDLFALIDRTPNLDWLLLTKRPENVIKMCPDYIALDDDDPAPVIYGDRFLKPRKNVWIGTSVSDQETADHEWDQLQRCNPIAHHLFLSIEPLVAPIDMEHVWRNSLLPDWVIVGGESGNNARPCKINWVQSVVEQCKGADVPVFVKQLGAHSLGYEQGTAIAYEPRIKWKDKKGGDPSEWPKSLRVRQFPSKELVG